MSPPPSDPTIYHIVHVDRLPSIIAAEELWCDAEVASRVVPGTMIGMSEIKARRLRELTLGSYPDLYVGDCVPFYFCPRSVMLYVIDRANHPELAFRGGQGSIVHLVADLRAVVAWAECQGRRWAFTTSNAGSRYFEDYVDLRALDQIDWNAVGTRRWSGNKEGKQAEFLVEKSCPWELVSRIGVMSRPVLLHVHRLLASSAHRPTVQVERSWYY